MKILIFGVGGMAGHVLFKYFKSLSKFEVWGTARSNIDHLPHAYQLNVLDKDAVLQTIQYVQPEVVINAVGLLNQFAERNVLDAIYVNSLFPHLLAQYGLRNKFKLIHISTDCVFSGLRGDYKETDIPDGTSVYAKSKSLGDVVDTFNLTIRTSIIGPELKSDGIGLFDWFLKQQGQIQGFRNVVWNGVTTIELAKAIEWSLSHNISGLVHLTSPNKISKYDLLRMMKETFGKDVQIVACDEPCSDRSLSNTRSDFNVPVPPYQTMMKEMKAWME